MEYEVVSVKVPKCLFPDDVELVFLESEEDKLERDCSLAVVRHPASFRKDNFVCLLVARPKPLKPDWNPPKLKKGWLTWDGVGGWYWWENRPEYHAADAWTYPQSEDVFENEEIGSMMAELLGCPCCDGFDERNCIWEVGE